MINKIENINKNLIIRQMLYSDAMAYNKKFLAKPTDSNFNILKAFEGTEKVYAELELKVKSGECQTENCEFELASIAALQSAPRIFVEFMENLGGELSVTEEENFDVVNNADYTIAQSMLTEKPGFSRSDGYEISLELLEDSSQEITFTGPGFYEPLIINSSTLKVLLNSGTFLIASTPDINKDMTRLLTEVGLFSPDMVNPETGELLQTAKLLDEFVLKNPDGTPIYEIVEIGNGKGRNILRYDLDKIERKTDPFINAEVAGLLDREQEAVASWNVYLAELTSVEEDDQMTQNATAYESAWQYEKVLPLSQSKKMLFMDHYKKYFMKNYLVQFTTNQLPDVQEDAAVFDVAEKRKENAKKYMEQNKLS